MSAVFEQQLHHFEISPARCRRDRSPPLRIGVIRLTPIALEGSPHGFRVSELRRQIDRVLGPAIQ
jgi:hypothetical protein